jgi:hypothetical protein
LLNPGDSHQQRLCRWCGAQPTSGWRAGRRWLLKRWLLLWLLLRMQRRAQLLRVQRRAQLLHRLRARRGQRTLVRVGLWCLEAKPVAARWWLLCKAYAGSCVVQ